MTDRRDEVQDFMEGVLRGCASEKSKLFRNALYDVLFKTWNDSKIKKRIHEIGLILFVDAASLFKYGFYEARTPMQAKGIEDKLCCPPAKWVFVFPSWLTEESEARIRYAIAHELARFALRHEESHSHEKYLKDESAADILMARWGFKHPREG